MTPAKQCKILGGNFNLPGSCTNQYTCDSQPRSRDQTDSLALYTNSASYRARYSSSLMGARLTDASSNLDLSCSRCILTCPALCSTQFLQPVFWPGPALPPCGEQRWPAPPTSREPVAFSPFPSVGHTRATADSFHHCLAPISSTSPTLGWFAWRD